MWSKLKEFLKTHSRNIEKTLDILNAAGSNENNHKPDNVILSSIQRICAIGFFVFVLFQCKICCVLHWFYLKQYKTLSIRWNWFQIYLKNTKWSQTSFKLKIECAIHPSFDWLISIKIISTVVCVCVITKFLNSSS